MGGKLKIYDKQGWMIMGLVAALSAPAAERLDSSENVKQKKIGGSALTSDESEVKADKRNLSLSVGEDKIVDLKFSPDEKTVRIGNKEVVTYSLIVIGGVPKQIQFTPTKPGSTTVTLRDKQGNVRLIFNVYVTDSNLSRLSEEIKVLLRDVEGVGVRIFGDKIVVDGEVLVPSDYGRVFGVISDPAYSKYVLNLTTLSPIAMKLVAKRVEQDVKNFAPNVTTRVVNKQVWLEGTVPNLATARQAERVAKLYLPDYQPPPLIRRDENAEPLPPRSLVQNFIVVDPAPPKKQEKLVRITMHFVELSKDYNKIFGFKWQPGFTANPSVTIGVGDAASGAAGGASFTATISSLFPKLQSARDAGFARVLRTGTVVVRSGQPASLNDETLIPFAITGPNGQTATSTAGVGLSMSLTPTILGQSQDIQMDVNVAQINLVGQTKDDAPITSKHEVKTRLYVASAESAAIAGLKSSDIQTNFNKGDPNPGIFDGQTDPLFTLQRSKSFAKKRAQYVIFVTPEIINNASEGTADLKKNFRVKVK